MTMPPPVSQAPPPVAAKPSAAAFWASQLDQAAFEEVIREVAKEHAENFRWKREALLKAIHLRKKGPSDRLADYMSRPQQNWQALREVLPEVYREQTRDWHDLEAKVMAGEMAPPPPQGPAPIAPEPLPQIATTGFGPGRALPLAEQKAAERQAVSQYTPPAPQPAGPNTP